MKPALFFFVLCLPVIAAAQSNSGAELRNSGADYASICGPTAQGQANPRAGACNVWLTGVMDGLQAYNSNAKSIPLFDAPDVTVGQVSKLTLKYVADHPDRAQLPTAALVLGALMENYPRKEATGKP
jgi:hypothetical protein